MLHVIFDEEYAKLKLSTSFISTFVRITQKLRKRQRAFAIHYRPTVESMDTS